MDFSKVFSSVSTVLQQRKQARAESYLTFVVQIADGNEPDLDALADMLDSVGKSANDLASDVELILNRRKWKAQLDRQPYWENERSRIHQTIEQEQKRINEAIQRLQAEYSKSYAELTAQEREVSRQIDLCSTSYNKLIETSGRQNEISELSLQRAAPLREIEGGDLGKELRRARLAVASARSRLSIEEGLPEDQLAWGGAKREGTITELEQQLRNEEAKLEQIQREVNQRVMAAEELKRKIDRTEAESLSVS